VLYAPISTAVMGNTTIVAGVTGKNIRVVSYILVAAGSVTVQWQSGSTGILSGAMSLIVGNAVHVDPAGAYGGSQLGVLETLAQGDALILILGGAVQISGHVSYTLTT
jgi:hypothetical protein